MKYEFIYVRNQSLIDKKVISEERLDQDPKGKWWKSKLFFEDNQEGTFMFDKTGYAWEM